jgi:lactate permease
MDATLVSVGAAVPILWLLFSLGFLKMPSHRACPIALGASVAAAVGLAGMAPIRALEAVAEGALFALLPILWVIVAAFFTYDVSRETGALERMKRLLSGISGDRRIQVLLIAWGFGGFMESTAGFGTAVAVPAAILIALGFEPFAAAFACLLANTVAVAFGVVGIPLTTLARITDLPIPALSADVVFQLTPFVLVLPPLLVFSVVGGLEGMKGAWIASLAAGLAYAVAQYLTAAYVGPELTAVAGSIASFAAVALCAKLLPPASEWRFPGERREAAEPSGVLERLDLRAQFAAWSPYLFLLLIVLGSSRLVPAVNRFLGGASSTLLVYRGEGGKPLRFDWLLTPGTMLFVSAVLGGLVQRAGPRRLAGIFVGTLGRLGRTAITVASILAMAKVLAYGGMVGSLAAATAAFAGQAFPLVSPAVGALGTFLTGSDTSSNILFGLLQKQTALRLGLDPVWIAAANTSGACVGKLVSPQSIAVAAAAASLSGRESDLLVKSAKFAAAFLAALGLLVYAFAR